MYTVLFHIGSVPVYSYGFMIALGIIAALLLGIKCGKFRGFTSLQVINLINTAFLSGVIGARLLYVLFNLRAYCDSPLNIFHVWSGGLSWHGGVLAGLAGITLYARKEKLSLWDTWDFAVLTGILGLTFGRVGCFLHGCCYGKITDLPWAVVFPAHGPCGRHPTQIYEGILDLIIFLILLRLWKKNNFRGEVLCYFLGLYSAARFFVEFFRDNTAGFTPFLLGLNIAQIIS